MIVLVTYASKHGATERIAERVREVLSDAGVATTLLPASLVKDISAYDAVILGSAVYQARWRESAVRFLKTFEEDLKARKVWLFSSGPTGKGEAAKLMNGWLIPEELRAIVTSIEPEGIQLFHGSIDFDQLTATEKLIVKAVQSPVGDFRDWRAITLWAEQIVEVVTAPLEAAI